MQISELTFQNFRCFGDAPVRIALTQLTTLIGANGCGKSAVLQGLSRLFGTSSAERTIEASDFHLAPGASRDELKADDELNLAIEAKLSFPELDDEEADLSSLAACFKQMSVTGPEGELFCRIRLEAKWTKGNLPEGEVEQKLYWIRSSDPTPNDKHKTPMASHERAQIHVHYIPAARDPLKQIRYVSGTILSRLLGAVRWSDEIVDTIEASHDEIREAFAKEDGVVAVEAAVNAIWNELHDAKALSKVTLKPLGRRLQELLRHLQAVFSPSADGEPHELDRLSDGLKSMFYLAMVGAAFDIENQVVSKDAGIETHFILEELNPPVLTVFAMEEPENHIAPHYLGRIVTVFRDLIASTRAQTLITSHSPSVLQRIEPNEVRHLRLNHKTHVTLVNAIRLPDEASEAFKFVRQAVCAYPELYFARLVLLGEGDSEEIVLPKIAAARGVQVDTSFVSIVPLGGRHVNHLWRLLTDLDIPHLTLLDLDRERHGGGWSRIQYAMKELLKVGARKTKLLQVAKADDEVETLSERQLDELSERDVADTDDMEHFIKHLESFGVFYSAPLDFDFLMLRFFPKLYKHIEEGADGPTIPKDRTTTKGKKAYDEVIRAVLKPKGGDGSTYTDRQRTAFFWYRYLFLGRGKPVTHLHGMSKATKKELRDDAPQVLRRLCRRMKELLTVRDLKDTDDG